MLDMLTNAGCFPAVIIMIYLRNDKSCRTPVSGCGFALEIRQTMAILVFSPISIAIPPFTAEMKSDVGLSSSFNSATIICSLVIMTVLMAVIL